MSLSADQKEQIIASRGEAAPRHHGMTAWLVALEGGGQMTMISDRCKTAEDVEAAILEKFNKKATRITRA